MTKRFANLALVYALVAMAFGVFYREFTKFCGFAGRTSLGLLHTHYFVLGMGFFLLLAAVEKSFSLPQRSAKRYLLLYQLGLNIAGLGFLLRGLSQVLGAALSRGLDASISGVAGIGHILLSVGMVGLLLQIRKQAA